MEGLDPIPIAWITRIQRLLLFCRCHGIGLKFDRELWFASCGGFVQNHMFARVAVQKVAFDNGIDWSDIRT